MNNVPNAYSENEANPCYICLFDIFYELYKLQSNHRTSIIIPNYKCICNVFVVLPQVVVDLLGEDEALSIATIERL